MILSIGMIVKNEEKYLEQCLAGIKPILDNVDSELIICDTGSTDRSIEIAKKFTDNVYSFEWNNDFAAARNSTVDRAKGKWYMFLDADEIFVSCDDIIKFFNSGEYKKYSSASYIERSYFSETLTEYTELYPLRLSKIYKGFRFIYPIHECFNSVQLPTKHLNDVNYHYGYVFKDKNGNVTELAREKCNRNLDMLLQFVDETPEEETQYGVYKEISDCYNMVGDIESALKYAYIGYEKRDHEVVNISLYYDQLTVLLRKLKRYDELEKIINEFFNEPFHGADMASDVNMYAFLIESYIMRQNYPEAIKYMPAFFELYTKFKQGKLCTDDLIHIGIHADGNYFKYFCIMCMQLCINMKNYETALYVIDRIPVDNYQSDQKWAESFIDNLLALTENSPIDAVRKYISALNSNNKEVFVKKTGQKLLLERYYPLDYAFQKYGEICEECARDENTADSVNVRAGLIINSISRARLGRNFKLCIEEMRRLLKEYPQYAGLISEYKKYVQKDAGLS